MFSLLLAILIISLALLITAGACYGRRVLRNLGADNKQPTAAVRLNDGKDFIPAKPYVLFAHHFAAIAGAGPIIGPALAMSYGYVPVLLWLVIGSTIIGGIHDTCALFISQREDGKSIADIARRLVGQRGYILIVGLLAIGLVLITATFLNLTVTALTSMYPAEKIGLTVPEEATIEQLATLPPAELKKHPSFHGVYLPLFIHKQEHVNEQGEVVTKPRVIAKIGGIASTSVIIITLFAPLLGWLIYRVRTSAWLNYGLATILCIGSIWGGVLFPIQVDQNIWRLMITGYVIVASAVPVWLLLMPRDFVNVQILYGGLLALILGIFVQLFSGNWGTAPIAPHQASESIPAFDLTTGTAALGFIWPILFITISCGAISGFHSLVCGGTTAKQVARESHTRTVGYWAMLLESAFAICVVLTLLLGLNWESYRDITWGERNPVLAVALATGNLFHSAFSAPAWVGTIIGILLLEGFVVTTLDVAVRLNRYLFEELWRSFWPTPPAWLTSRWTNTLIAVVLMYLLSKTNALGVLWQVFGTANQMMAAITLMVITLWLKAHGRNYLFTLLPCLFMFATTIAAAALALWKNVIAGNWLLTIASALLLILAVSLLLIGARSKSEVGRRKAEV